MCHSDNHHSHSFRENIFTFLVHLHKTNENMPNIFQNYQTNLTNFFGSCTVNLVPLSSVHQTLSKHRFLSLQSQNLVCATDSQRTNPLMQLSPHTAFSLAGGYKVFIDNCKIDFYYFSNLKVMIRT